MARLPLPLRLPQARPRRGSHMLVGCPVSQSPRDLPPSSSVSGKTPAAWEPPSPARGGQGGTHLDQLVPAQPVDDLDDEVLGDLEVLQPDALRAVQHEQDVDGAALALCRGRGRGAAAARGHTKGVWGAPHLPQGPSTRAKATRIRERHSPQQAGEEEKEEIR